MEKEIPFNQITEQEYNIALEDSARKTCVMAIQLSKSNEVKYIYIETALINVAERLMLKTYLNDLYKAGWDKIEFSGYN